MADGSIIINTKIDQSGFKQGHKQLSSGLGGITKSLKGVAVAAGIAFSATAIVSFGKKSVQAATELKNALAGLKSIMDGQGRSFAQAQGFIDSYTSDGLIPATEAITAYKNLALRGYDDSQIQQVMQALKDSSAFGRQASYTMGEAVKSATEGLKNENSILVDNAGVTKNVAKMWDDYAKSIGTTSNNLTKQQKIQAEVLGIMEETKFQTGDAAKVSGGFSGQLLRIGYSLNNLKVALGNTIIPILETLLPILNTIITALTKIFNLTAQLSTALFSSQASQLDETAKSTQKAADAQSELADQTTKAANAAKKSTTSFDELNIIQTKEDGSAETTTSGISSAPSSGSSGEIKSISPKVQNVANNIKETFGLMFSGLKREFDEINKLLEPTFSGWGTAIKSLKQPIIDTFKTVGKSVVDFKTKSLKPTYEYITKDWVPTIANKFTKTFAPIFEKVMPVILKEGAKNFKLNLGLISKAVDDVFMPAMEFMKTATTDVFDSISAAWDEHGTSILEGFSEFQEGLREIWANLYDNVFKPVFDSIGSTISNLWDEHLKPLYDKIADFVGTLIEYIQLYWNKYLLPFVNFIVEKFGPPIAKVVGYIGEVFSTAFGIIADAVGLVLDVLTGILDFIIGVFTGDWERAWNGVKKIFKGIWDGMYSIVKGIINLIIDGLNLLWSGVYKVMSGLTNGIGKLGEALGELLGQDWELTMPKDPPKIPRLARGGIVDAPTTALIGEAGREAVLPLENNTGWMDILADKISSRGGGVCQLINKIYLDGKLIKEDVVDMINQDTILSGRSPILGV